MSASWQDKSRWHEGTRDGALRGWPRTGGSGVFALQIAAQGATAPWIIIMKMYNYMWFGLLHYATKLKQFLGFACFDFMNLLEFAAFNLSGLAALVFRRHIQWRFHHFFVRKSDA